MNRTRLKLTLSAQSDFAYNNAYHHDLRKCVFSKVPNRMLEDHNTSKPLGISYTNPIPWGDTQQGDKKHIIISAISEELLVGIASKISEDPTFNIGEMEFEVAELSEHTVDVGEPGTEGTIKTDTGVHVSFSPKQAKNYGIDTTGNCEHFWRETDPLRAIQDSIENNLILKWEQHVEKHHNDGPNQLKGPVFDDYELMKTYAVPLTVTSGETRTTVLSKWKLGYTVRSEAHRDTLNMALSTGIGSRNGMGLGAISISQKQSPQLKTNSHHS